MCYVESKVMAFNSALKRALLSAVVVGALGALALDTAPAQDTAPAGDSKGLPPRAAPSDYQAQGQAGALTIAAEFAGHSVPTPDAIFTTDDYVVVEIGLFGKTPAKIALTDFSLRINGGKKTIQSQPYELTFRTMMDPAWEPPKQEDKSNKTSFGGGGGGGGGGAQDSGPPPVVHMPMEIRRPMEQRVTKAAMLEGERPLPRAGLIFFEYHSKVKSIRSLELIYSGAAGNLTLPLHP
jgi:hypothetical protein